jgi:hypothetical protein
MEGENQIGRYTVYANMKDGVTRPFGTKKDNLEDAIKLRDNAIFVGWSVARIFAGPNELLEYKRYKDN